MASNASPATIPTPMIFTITIWPVANPAVTTPSNSAAAENESAGLAKPPNERCGRLIVGVPFLAKAGQQKHLVVDREPEQKRQDQHEGGGF